MELPITSPTTLPVNDNLTEDQHWNKLFYLCAFLITVVMVYCFLITFVKLDKENAPIANQILIFFIGTLVGFCFNLLSPGITSKRSPRTEVSVTGDNTIVRGSTTGATQAENVIMEDDNKNKPATP